MDIGIGGVDNMRRLYNNSIKKNIPLSQKDKKILELFLNIEDSKINYNKSNIYLKNDLIIVNIISKNRIYCPITLHFGINSNKDQFNFFYGESALIIETSLDDNVMDETISLIRILLTCRVKEELYMINNKIVKSKYFFECKIKNQSFNKKYLGINRTFTLFRHKNKVVNVYKPWFKNIVKI